MCFGFLLIDLTVCSRIEVVHIQWKDFSGFGFVASLNLSFLFMKLIIYPFDAGIYTPSKNKLDVRTVPLYNSYRYTMDRSAYGFYLGSLLGYSIGDARIAGERRKLVTNGVESGLGLGYLFESTGKIQSNLSLGFLRGFGLTGINSPSLRYNLAYRFCKRE